MVSCHHQKYRILNYRITILMHLHNTNACSLPTCLLSMYAGHAPTSAIVKFVLSHSCQQRSQCKGAKKMFCTAGSSANFCGTGSTCMNTAGSLCSSSDSACTCSVKPPPAGSVCQLYGRLRLPSLPVGGIGVVILQNWQVMFHVPGTTCALSKGTAEQDLPVQYCIEAASPTLMPVAH